jgi:hypothetical protein
MALPSGKAEHVIDAMGFAPDHQRLASKAGIGTEDDLHPPSAGCL